MEIEAKYRVTAEALGTVAHLRRLGAYTLAPAPAPEQQTNTYYDTADGRLAAARHGLRVRRVGERSLITLKGPAEVGPDGVHRRAEHEFPGADPRPAAWPPGVARELGLALTGGAPVGPTVTVATERHILHVERAAERVAELCLDRGVLRAGGRERPFAEIEIELLPAGQRSDLAAIAAALGAHVALHPERQSKLQRAMELLREASRT
ncbi:MAG TPA: CYTH domain-containing protein [Chloroflexaceae bacterium]|nr:CYTH domain-containing protein [Chloroflexaceae bacterium]